MKKIVIIVITCCYLVGTFGLSITSHFCGGKLSSFSFKSSSAKKCLCVNKKEKKNCCKTEILKPNQNAAHQPSYSNNAESNESIAYLPFYIVSNKTSLTLSSNIIILYYLIIFIHQLKRQYFIYLMEYSESDILFFILYHY